MSRHALEGSLLRPAFLGMLLVLYLSSCGSFSMRGKLDQSVDRYNDLVRGKKLDAASLFAAESLSREYGERAEKARNLKIVDYRVLGTKYDEKKSEAEVRVEIDYVSASTYLLKTVVDVQRWAYLEEGGKKRWRLTSLLPEFK